MTHTFRFGRILVFSTFAICSCAGLPVAFAQTPGAPNGNAASEEMKSNPAGMPTTMKDMNDKMTGMQVSGNQDVDFATMMKMHQQGAISMAEAELRDGKNPQMRSMAKK